MRTDWEKACDWYRVDNVAHAIKSESGDEIPTDVRSREFAVWLTNEYRLAMAKGMQLARDEIPDDRPG